MGMSLRQSYDVLVIPLDLSPADYDNDRNRC